MSEEKMIDPAGHASPDSVLAGEVEATLRQCREIYRKDTRRAIALAEALLPEAERAGYHYGVAQLLHMIGGCMYLCAELESALSLLERARAIFTGMGEEKMTAEVLQALAGVYSQSGDTRKAMEIFTENLRLFEQSGDKAGMGRALMNMGTINRTWGNYADSLEQHLRALSLWQDLNREAETGMCYNNIASTYYTLADSEKVIHYLGMSLASSLKSGDRFLEAMTRQNLGKIMIERGETGPALESLELSKQIYRSLRSFDKEAAGWVITGMAHEGNNDEDAALLCYSHALELVGDKSRDIRGKACLSLGSLYLKKNMPEKARACLEDALAEAEAIGDCETEYRVHELFSELYAGLGRTDKAYMHLKRYISLREQILGNDKQRIIATMEARIEIVKAEKEKELYRLNAERLEREMQYKEQELTASALHLVRKNEFLEEIRARLTHSLRSYHVKDGVRSLLRQIQQYINSKEWETLEQHFRELHKDFISTLSKNYPGLSTIELRICLLLKAKLSSKEMANLLCLSIRTIDSHRRSIRKKLGLHAGANLTVFLNSI